MPKARPGAMLFDQPNIIHKPMIVRISIVSLSARTGPGLQVPKVNKG